MPRRKGKSPGSIWDTAPAAPARADGGRILAALDWAKLMRPGGSMSALIAVGSGPDRVASNCAGLAYIAAPYEAEAHVSGKWREKRSVMLSVAAARELLLLTHAGVASICPTLMRAAAIEARDTVEINAPDPLDHEFWARWSAPYLNVAALVVVPEIPGWQRCPMIARDVAWALARNIPVHLYARAAA